MKTTIAFLIFILPLFGYAQTNLPQLSINNPGDVTDYLTNDSNRLDLDTLCISTVVFIKFSVTEKGEITNLGFTKGTHPAIKEALKKGMLSSNGHWEIKRKDKAALKNNIYILPFIIDTNEACRGNSELTLPHDPQKTITILVRQLQAHQSNKALDNLLFFDDMEFGSKINCILLAPVGISSMTE